MCITWVLGCRSMIQREWLIPVQRMDLLEHSKNVRVTLIFTILLDLSGCCLHEDQMFIVSHITQHCLHDVCFSLDIIIFPLVSQSSDGRNNNEDLRTKLLMLTWVKIECIAMPLTKSPKNNHANQDYLHYSWMRICKESFLSWNLLNNWSREGSTWI